MEENVYIRLKNERLSKKVTQKMISDVTDVSIKTVGRWEKEVPIPSDKLSKLVDLGLDVTYIITGIRQHSQAKHVQDTIRQFLPLLPEEQRAKHEQKLAEIEVETAQIQAKRMGRYLDAMRLFNSFDDETFDRVEKNIMDAYHGMLIRDKQVKSQPEKTGEIKEKSKELVQDIKQEGVKIEKAVVNSPNAHISNSFNEGGFTEAPFVCVSLISATVAWFSIMGLHIPNLHVLAKMTCIIISFIALLVATIGLIFEHYIRKEKTKLKNST